MTVTELIESMKAIVDGYDSSFAKRMEEIPKEAKTERKALHIQRGVCNTVTASGLLAYVPNPDKAAVHMPRLEQLFHHDSKDYAVYSALDGDERRLAAVYLDTIKYLAFVYRQREAELAMAKSEGNDDEVFSLTIRIDTANAILNDLRAWWKEHGCAEFEV